MSITTKTTKLRLPKFLVNLDPRIYLSDNYRVIDFETTNASEGSALDPLNRVVCWVGLDGRTGEVCQRYNQSESELRDELTAYTASADFVVAHYAKFELQWLYRIGAVPGTILVYDTYLGQWCIDGNRKSDKSLNGLASRYSLGAKESVVSKLIKGGVCPSIIPKERLTSYCTQDVLLTNEVFLKQRSEILSLDLLPVLFTRNLKCMVLADIEKNGMCLDSKVVKQLFYEKGQAYQNVLSELHEFTDGINPNSPKQKATFLYETLKFEELEDYNGNAKKTASGKPMTDIATILALKATTKRQRQFKGLMERFSPLNKEMQSLEKMLNCVENSEDKGILPILYAEIKQGITVTHRDSSTGKEYKIQFQNIDREFKRVICARQSGWQIGDADAPQLEFRAAMHLSGDPVGIREIKEHFDVHRFTASIIHKTLFGDVTDIQRTESKPHTFKPLYGGSSGTPDERRYYKAFREKYNVTYKTQEGWTHDVLRNKSLRIASGLRFYWPWVKIHDSGYIKHSSEIFNYPVQSLATAEIIPIALIYLWYLLRANDCRSYIINTVHDSILTEVAPGEEVIWESCVRTAFTTATFEYLKRIYGIEWTVPLGAEYGLGTNWGTAKLKKLYEVDPLTGQAYEKIGKEVIQNWN